MPIGGRRGRRLTAPPLAISGCPCRRRHSVAALQPRHRIHPADSGIAVCQANTNVQRPTMPSTVHRLPSRVNCPPSTVQRPSSIAYSPQFTVHRSPFTVHCSSSTVYRPVFTVDRQPVTAPATRRSGATVTTSRLVPSVHGSEQMADMRALMRFQRDDGDCRRVDRRRLLPV